MIPPPSKARYRVLALLCLAAAIAYICRNSVGVVESTIRDDLNLNKTQSGLMMSLFFFAYALGQIPASAVSIRIGNRKALGLVAVAWSFATAMTTLAITFPLLIVSRLLNGVAQAGIFPNTTMVVARWFPKTQRAVATGAIGSSMSIGAAVGVALTGFLMRVTDWRVIFALFSTFGVLWAAAFYVWFRNAPEDHPDVSPGELERIQADNPFSSPSEDRRPIPWLRLLLSPATMLISAQQFFRAAGYIFFASWFATYLQEARGVARSTSGLLNSLPLFAVVVGAWSGGFLSDTIMRRTGSIRLARKAVATTAMVTCAFFTLIAFYINDPAWASLTISLGAFCATLGGNCAYTITIDLGGRNAAPLFATMNMIGNLGAFAFIQGVGMVMDAAKAGGWETRAWNGVFLSFGVVHLLAGLCWFLLRTDRSALEQSFIQPRNETP